MLYIETLMKYEAIYLPYTESDNPSKGGFATEGEAWDYIKTQLCALCSHDKRPLASMCAAEWDVEIETLLTNQEGK